MLDAAILLVFCLLAGVLSLALCGWVVISGRVFSLDGLLLVLLALLIGGLFLANVAWSVYTGEFQQVLGDLRRKGPPGGGPPTSGPPAAT